VRVIGLDISLASTGFADITNLYHDSHRYGLKCRSIETDPIGTDLISVNARMQVITDRIVALIYQDGDGTIPTLVVVEGPSMGSIQGSHNISGNWWRIVGRLLSTGLPVMQVAPGSLKLYATGSGSMRGATKVTKGMVVKAVNDRYDVGPIALTAKDNDQADAIVLAAIGARLLGHPIDPHIPAPNLRALTKIRLPEGMSCP
jgi:crossover junction endodeoxyribonuclease RuvC